MVKRVYVEKKPDFDVASAQLLSELRDILQIDGLTGVRTLNRYDVEGIDDDLFKKAVSCVFSVPAEDNVVFELEDALSGDKPTVIAVEYLPGQFDQRADSASECIQLISQGLRPEVRSATLYLLEGSFSYESVERMKNYLINPVESREASLELPETLSQVYAEPADVEVIDGFRGLDANERSEFIIKYGLAMDVADLEFCQNYFACEQRDPTITEIKVIDTYWSDHCRHTTFSTVLDEVNLSDAPSYIQGAYQRYIDVRLELGRDNRDICMMDIGTIGAKWLVANGYLKNLDVSDEINACTVRAEVDIDGVKENWLYLFKNETHNHPTEIEPFGGAATCVGGAIRDPLSGRAYVYQAMRVTGAADPRTPIEDTIPNKLPQRKIVTSAAEGYSSYGNQIGLATGQVCELYHPGYAAKHMEIGAVIGAAPAENVQRSTPEPGDVVVLLGGRTGRDGIGGATGSSKAHDAASLETCGAEVQKGNAPIERKIQRLFRRHDASSMIKRCNDFGAGGVSVAIGELADGLHINLDAVPRKYEGLDGTELAISESQERMACVLSPEDVETFISLANEENLEASVVATVSDNSRVRIEWRGNTIVDLSREFLSSNGAVKHQKVEVSSPKHASFKDGFLCFEGTEDACSSGEKAECKASVSLLGVSGDVCDNSLTFASRMAKLLANPNIASNKGLAERFDSTIGAASVLMPFGGTRQLTPSLAMVAKLPVFGETQTSSGFAWGFNPYITEANPYVGAYLAVVESVSKLVASGFKRKNVYLTFQEYFEKLGNNGKRWGKPTSALLGALSAQLDLKVGAIGGKDSMSGTYEDLNVPPTLVSFATALENVSRITSPEFKGTGHRVMLIEPAFGECANLFDGDSFVACMNVVEQLIEQKRALAVYTPGFGGLAEALFKMCVGNRVGFEGAPSFCEDDLFRYGYGSFIIELKEEDDAIGCTSENVRVREIGRTVSEYKFTVRHDSVSLETLQEAWESALEDVYPYRDADISQQSETISKVQNITSDTITYDKAPVLSHANAQIAKPRVVIPVFPGTNCEYDTAAAFKTAGAIPEILVINNMDPQKVADSAKLLAESISRSQIVMLPGGFSGGDEPAGSAKFIAAFFRSPEVSEAVRELLQHRDGLMLGICNGFQALVKLGLLPYGDITDADMCEASLTFNTLGRHQSKLVNTRVSSNLSPWLSECEIGEVYSVPVSHGEGRFIAPDELLNKMVENGQVATQYVNDDNLASMSLEFNPNGSLLAIEGITSPDGRVFGKMGHSERRGSNLYKNVSGNQFQPIFEAGVKYYS